jgi:hypothetical protein
MPQILPSTRDGCSCRRLGGWLLGGMVTGGPLVPSAFPRMYPVLSWSGERAYAPCPVLDRPGDPTTEKIEDSQGLVASHPHGIGL